MKPLKSLISKVFSFLTSPKGKAAIDTAAELVPKAAPIVAAIAALTPNRSDDELAAAFSHYGQPFASDYLALGPGAALLHLATNVLAAEVPGTATSIIQTAIQLAYTGSAK